MSAVKTAKKLLRNVIDIKANIHLAIDMKADIKLALDMKADIQLAILDHRNTPSQGHDMSGRWNFGQISLQDFEQTLLG